MLAIIEFILIMSNIYIAISTQNQENNIKDLTSVYQDFDGICAVDHFSTDGTYNVLSERCKNGFVAQIPYYGHHAHDLNHIILNPKIKLGDWVLLRDSCERINTNFASNIRPFINMLENNGVNTVYQHSKLLLFRRFPHQFFTSTPHWGFNGGQNKIIAIEKQTWFKEDTEYCYSVRNQRAPYSWVDHYMRYYLILDSNHNLLGAENFGEPKSIFEQKEYIRINFLYYLDKHNVNHTVDDFLLFLNNQKDLCDELKWYINNIRIINDFYRYHILKNTDNLTDDITRPCQQIP